MIFEELVHKTLAQLSEIPVEETIQKILNADYPLESPNLENWISKVKKEVEGFGPIGIFLQDPEISEICINRFDLIFIEKHGQLTNVSDRFVSPLTFDRFIKYLFLLMEKAGDRRHPFVDGMLGSSTRVHIVLPPITENPIVSIRKKVEKTWNLATLEELGMMNSRQGQKISKWLMDKKNILVCGPTSSGKTTLLRAMLLHCGSEDRIVSIEDTRELSTTGPHHVNLLSRIDPEGLVPSVDLSQLLKNVLRMRPDRVVVGEVRGEEAVVLLDALATGHRGSFSTIHASTAAHALKRLESLVSRACPRWDLSAIRQLIFDSIDVVIVCEKKNGLRKISQTAELTGVESFGYLLDSETY